MQMSKEGGGRGEIRPWQKRGLALIIKKQMLQETAHVGEKKDRSRPTTSTSTLLGFGTENKIKDEIYGIGSNMLHAQTIHVVRTTYCLPPSTFMHRMAADVSRMRQ